MFPYSPKVCSRLVLEKVRLLQQNHILSNTQLIEITTPSYGLVESQSFQGCPEILADLSPTVIPLVLSALQGKLVMIITKGQERGFILIFSKC